MKHTPELAETILSLLEPRGNGLEVAPYFDPMLPKGGDYNVWYTDYIDTGEIRALAATNPSSSGAEVPAIDFVWTPGKNLRACAPSNMEFDYAVASHVMEHVPDPVGWLSQLLSVLRVGGRIALFLPDRRNSFDFARRATTFAELVGLWIAQPCVPTPQQVADFMGEGLSQPRGSHFTAEFGHPDEATRFYTDAQAVDAAAFVAVNSNYLNVHATVWEPDQFVDVFKRLIEVGMLNVSMSKLAVAPVEFAVVLTKLGEPARSPPPKPAAVQGNDHLTPLLDNAIHQLNVVRGDLTFSVSRIHDIAVALAQQSAELAALRRDLARQTERNWGLSRLILTSWRQRPRIWGNIVGHGSV